MVAEIHATDFLSSLVHEGVADFMSRFVFRLNPGKDPSRIRDVTVALDSDGLKATLKPSNRLAADRRYRAVVTTEAKDMAGNALDQDRTASGNQPKVWAFST